MLDVLFIAVVIAFFAIAAGAVHVCDRVVRSADAPADATSDVDFEALA